jgi:nucleoside-diphosphate-sugar epimerase
MKSSDKIILEDVARAVEGMDLSQFKNSRILLLGASGVMGIYFAYFFYYLNMKFGFNITADLYTKNPVGATSPLAFLVGEKGFSFFQHDASEYKTYDARYDFMIHSAGYASPSFFLKNPIKTIDINYMGMKSILESAVQYSPKAKILYVSSSEVYGSPTPENFPTPETYSGNSSITNNRACYIESKRLAEVLCLGYVRAHDLYVRIARAALFYGPGITMNDGRVMGQFMNKAYTEKEIKMVDDGKDLRCFCYVSDAMREMLEILLFGKEIIYNIGSEEEEISILDLATVIGKRLSVPVVPGPGKDFAVAGAPSRVHLDMKKVREEFNFIPRVGIEEGMGRLIDWNLDIINEQGEASSPVAGSN